MPNRYTHYRFGKFTKNGRGGGYLMKRLRKGFKQRVPSCDNFSTLLPDPDNARACRISQAAVPAGPRTPAFWAVARGLRDA